MSEPWKLLVVDDESEIRNGMGRLFPWDQVGFEVVGTCENGKQAFDYLVRHPVDAVLCDIRMPVLDGLAFAKQVRELGMTTTIIFFSAHRDFEYARLALEYGVRHYVVKSTRYEEMLRLFHSVNDELLAAAPRNEAAPGGDHYTRLVAAVVHYVQHHLAENPNLENMARHMGLSSDHLGRVFRATTGKNFSDFLMEARMTKAAEYLGDVGLKTYEVGALVGYYNAKNFTRAFKAYHGRSPREFRNPGAAP